MCALDDSFSFPAFLQENGKAYTDADGVFTVSSLEELYELAAGSAAPADGRSWPPRA